MRTLRRISLGMLVGLGSLALIAGAAARTSSGTKVRHVKGSIEALALDRSRIAYDVGSRAKASNRVRVWDVRSGKTRTVSGRRTRRADSTSTGSGVMQLALSGSRVAWLVNLGGNTESDDYVFTSSWTHPKERQVATEMRTGEACPGGPAAANPGCAGTWLGGVVGAAKAIALNRWTTDSRGSVTAGDLYVLEGTKMRQIADGAGTIEAVTADGGRIAVLRSDGSIGIYSTTGRSLLTVTPPSARMVALSNRNLVVLTKARTLAVYDSRTGSLRKTLPVRGRASQLPRNLDVQGTVAIYSTGTLRAGAIHAVDVASGKDRVVGRLHGAIVLAQIDKVGLVYAGNGYGSSYGQGTLVFEPFRRVAGAVGGHG